MINSINQVIHATTSGTGTGASRAARAARAAPAAREYGRRVPRRAASPRVPRAVHDTRRHRFSHAHAGAAKNQDPTSPVDSNEFLSQLASLSEVQGITQLNTSFATLSSSLMSNQALQASSLLGHQALVPSATATLRDGRRSRFRER